MNAAPGSSIGNVLISGAGPVGLLLAVELARFGVPVRIVDKAPQRTDKSKALVVWPRTMELLERVGCAAAFKAAGQPAGAANIFGDGRRIARVTLDGIASAYPYALMIPQSETERVLEERLQALGVRVERGTETIAFREAGDRVQATLRDSGGRDEVTDAAWLAGCDGAHSFVRQHLGMSFDGDTLPSDWMLADVQIFGVPVAAMELLIYWHADGVLALFPMSSTRYRVVADVGPSVGAHPATPTLAEVQAAVDRRGPGGMQLSDPVWLSGFRINERKVGNYRSGRAFVAGDAAHVHSPAGGQGMNTGMQDAVNLAWKLALVCRGECPAGLLDSYSEERSPVAEKVLRDTGRFTSVATLHNLVARKLRDVALGLLLGLQPVRQAAADDFSEITIGYPESSLSGPHARGLQGPMPGERFAPRPGEAPAGAGDAPRFAVLAKPSGAIAQIMKTHADLVEPELRPPCNGEGIWLVRPDGYVACCVADGSEDIIDGYLTSLSAR